MTTEVPESEYRLITGPGDGIRYLFGKPYLWAQHKGTLTLLQWNAQAAMEALGVVQAEQAEAGGWLP